MGVCVCVHDLISIEKEWVCTAASSSDLDYQSLNPAFSFNSDVQ